MEKVTEFQLSEHANQLKELGKENREQDMHLQRIEDKLDALEKQVHNILELFSAATGTIKVLKWLGGLAGWVAAIASAIGAIWYAMANFPDKG